MLIELGLTTVENINKIDRGKYGQETVNAVKTFQRNNKDLDDNSLVEDGLVGEKTADVLNRNMIGIWYSDYSNPLS